MQWQNRKDFERWFCQRLPRYRAQPAAADDEDAGGKDFFLSFDTDFVEKDVAAATEKLVVVHDEVVWK